MNINYRVPDSLSSDLSMHDFLSLFQEEHICPQGEMKLPLDYQRACTHQALSVMDESIKEGYISMVLTPDLIFFRLTSKGESHLQGIRYAFSAFFKMFYYGC